MTASPASFCQIEVGDIGVTFVPDGFISFTPEGAYPGSPDSLWEAHPEYLDDEGLMVMSLGVLLVRSGDTLALVDLGWGQASMDRVDETTGKALSRARGGTLLDNLARVGVAPGDVDVVLFSHLHSDHTGWIVDPATVGEGEDPGSARPLFANAVHCLSQAEWDYWTGPDASPSGPLPTAAQISVLGSRANFVEDGASPVPGVRVMATPGHTPGHLSFVISSGSERAVVLGDAVHCPIEISAPELEFVVDVDPKLAQRTRLHLEQELYQPGTIAAGAHFADLVFGRLLPGEGRSAWQFPASQALSVAGS